jgi:hypothetical protein
VSLRCSEKSVPKFTEGQIHLSLGAPVCEAIPPFEKADEMVAFAFNAVKFVRCEVSPLVTDLSSKLLPPGLQNIVMHTLFTFE